MSLPVEADRTLAPVLQHKFDGFVTCEVSNLGEHGGFLETLSVNEVVFEWALNRKNKSNTKDCHILL